MSKGFELNFINGPTGDPAVLLSILRTGEHILFDAGHLDSAPARDLLKVRNLFVSHTHVDHFIGFDRLIRLNIPHKRLLNVWGPLGLIQQVRYKLLAYTWNLIDETQLPFQVTEIKGSRAEKTGFLAKSNHFCANVRTPAQQDYLMSLEGNIRISGLSLDHNGIDSIVYHLQFPALARVDSKKLSTLGHKPGPWIQSLIQAAQNNNLEGGLPIDGKLVGIKNLVSDLIYFEDPQSLAYITDISFDKRNMESLQGLSQAKTLICESSFLDKDINRSVIKAHLTSKQAALIARILGAEEFIPFHVSNIYGEEFDVVLQEAQKYFEEFGRLSQAELESHVQSELSRVSQCRSDLGLV